MIADGACCSRSTKAQVARACATSSRREKRRGGRDPVPALLPQPGARDRVRSESCSSGCRTPSSPPRTSCRRNTASSSASRPSWRMPISARACSRYLDEIDARISARRLQGPFLVVQSTGGLYESDQAQARMRPHAGIRPGRRRRSARRRLCDALELDERDRLRHGRHHRQGRRDLRRRGADRLGRRWSAATTRPADPDPDDRHLEVGTGGGSIARVDAGGALRVGPQSAGAEPGPACYGRGGTRADGHRRQPGARAAAADRFLGGEMKLDERGRASARSASRSPSRSG